MRLRMAALMMTLLLALTACAGQEANAPDVLARQRYAALTEFSTAATITADYGDKVFCFDAKLSGDLTGGQLEVTAPAAVAGAVFGWQDGQGSLSYADVTLETGSLSPDGLSPVDAVPLTLTALVAGKQLATCEESLEGEETVLLELANPAFAEGMSSVLVWLSAENFALRRCEITWEGVTVITCVFTDFAYTTQMEG